MISSPEIPKDTAPDILSTCEEAFERAYKQDIATKHSYAVVRGDSIEIMMHTLEPDLDIKVRKPHSKAVISGGISYWVERKNKDPKVRENPPLLVAVDNSPQQLHMTDHEGDPTTPISIEETAQISRLIAEGDLVPVELNEPEF